MHRAGWQLSEADTGAAVMAGPVILFIVLPWLLYVYGPTIWGKR